jgi:hypothetical protein
MPSTVLQTFDFRESVFYDEARKERFHRLARQQLRLVAKALRLASSTFGLRSSRGGIAVSGEITLHSDHIYVQVSQPFGGFDSGILIRTCEGRKDYVGGRNHFASLDLLHRPQQLAQRIEQVCGERRIANDLERSQTNGRSAP